MVQRIPREQYSIQRYALTKILFRPVNPNFSKYGMISKVVDLFIKKAGRFQPKQGHLKIVKKIGLQAISLLFELVSSSTEVFWVLLIYLMLNAGVFILLYSTKSVLFDGDLRVMRILYLTQADIEHLQKCQLNSTIPPLPPISPQVETADFNVPEHIFQYDDGDNTGYFHTGGNEVMKPIPLPFNGFHRTGICQFIFNPIQMGEGKVQKRPLLVSLKLILLPHRCKIAGPYLVPVSYY